MRAWLRRPLPFGMWLVTVFVIGVLFGGGWWLYTRVQAARVDAIERLCLKDNYRSQAELDFLLFDAKSSPALIAKARRRFRIEPDCRRFATRAANEPPPQPAGP